MMTIINISITVLLILIGVFIKYKKVTWLISGYNTVSKEEKEKYDIDKLTYYMGNFVFFLSAVWGLITVTCILMPTQLDLVITVGLGVESVVMVGGIVFLNTGNRVKK